MRLRISHLYSLLNPRILTHVSTPLRHRIPVSRIIVPRPWHLARQFLERLTLRLRNQQCGKDTTQHEEGIDLHDVVEPWGSVRCGCTADAERADDDLGDDGADFAGSSGQTVRGGAVAGWEALAGDDEGSSIRTAVGRGNQSAVCRSCVERKALTS